MQSLSNLKVENFRTAHQRRLNAIIMNDVDISVSIATVKLLKEKDEVMSRV